jgi:hypothetical protein
MDDVDCFDLPRNAYTYWGPHPVICHPPCGPWGKYKSVSRQDKMAGLWALQLVRKLGGVVEQPIGSELFGLGQLVDQGDYGHLARKATKLLWG